MGDAVRLAKHYFKLSNEGRLAAIGELFSASSTYSSPNTGIYLGADQIMQMQSKFFASFKTLRWDVYSVEEVTPGVVLFDFCFFGESLDGELIQRRGLEYVVVFNGKLQHVEVRNKEGLEPTVVSMP